MNRKVIISHSFEETQKLAEELAADLTQPTIITLSGDLGSGKTTFTQGFAKGLGITQKIISPTFLIMRKYSLASKSQSLKINAFYHVDLYRIEDEKSIIGTGLLEVLKEKDSIIIIEWPEKMGVYLPEERIHIQLEYIDEDKRKMVINN